MDVSSVNTLEYQKMKTRHLISWRAHRWAIALIAALGMANALHAQQATTVTTPPKKETTMTATITPKEFWKQFVHLITERKGYVTHDRVEKILGVSLGTPQEMTWTKEEIVVGNMYGGLSPERWPAGIALEEYNGKKPHNPNSILYSGPPGISSWLFMDWSTDVIGDWKAGLSPDVFGDWKRSQCVVADDAIQVLLEAGWSLHGERMGGSKNMSGLWDGFSLGDGYLEMYHYRYETCVSRVRVTGTP